MTTNFENQKQKKAITHRQWIGINCFNKRLSIELQEVKEINNKVI